MFNAGMKKTSLQTKPYMLNNEATRIQSLGALVSIRASAEKTGGAFNLFDVICPIGFTTPLHIHYVEDVTVFVLDGALSFFWGDERKEAPAGTYLFQPKGTPHGFRVEGNAPARILYMTIPAGFDQFVIERAVSTNDFGAVAAARYKIEVLGPLPDSKI